MKKIIFIISIAILAISCTRPGWGEWSSTQDNNLSEQLFSDVWQSVQIAWEEEDAIPSSDMQGRSGSWLGNGVLVTLNHQGPGGTITVNFDNNGQGVVGTDNRLRKGQITVEYTDRYRNSGAVITSTTSNYQVSEIFNQDNLYTVSGSQTVTNKGKNSNDNTEFTVEVSNGKITDSDNEIATWNSTRTREWIAGENTPLIFEDDKYIITGSANGTSRGGINYTMNIEDPLHIYLDCQYKITKGELKISPDGYKERGIRFGDESCDNEVEIYIGNRSVSINLQ